MARTAFLTIIAVLFTASVSVCAETVNIRRYLLAAGANNGGTNRVLLRYAVSDAQAFANVLFEMGGVDKSNAIILTNPNSKELLGGITNLGKLVAGNNQTNARNEVFIYYSGHANDKGLLLGGELLPWTDFRNAVSGFNADVKVAVLDACGSGSITRTKGGDAYPAFLADASSNMKGYAFLTSSNEKEASQENDRIKSSYFTYALLSGMRGAADMTGDGKVTINELYHYTFNETLLSTQNTLAGTQHPSRDMNLAGTGDIVMTDLRVTNATLAIDADIEGQVFIREAGGSLFAELRKARGQAAELGMPRGKYSVQLELPSKIWLEGNIEIVSGKKTALAINDMKTMKAKSGVARGDGADGTMTSRVMNILDRGIYDAAPYADACGDFGMSLRAGAPRLYGLFDYGQPLGWDEWPKTMGLGLGTRFGMNGKFYVNMDAVWSGVFYNIKGEWVVAANKGPVTADHLEMRHIEDGFSLIDGSAKVRFGVNYRFPPFFAVTAGASANALFEDYTGKLRINDGKIERLNQSLNTGSMWSDYAIGGDKTKMRIWPSLYIGLTLGK